MTFQPFLEERMTLNGQPVFINRVRHTLITRDPREYIISVYSTNEPTCEKGQQPSENTVAEFVVFRYDVPRDRILRIPPDSGFKFFSSEKKITYKNKTMKGLKQQALKLYEEEDITS